MTKAADDEMVRLHTRMPVMLARNEFDCWLSGEFKGQEDVEALLAQLPAVPLGITAVSTIVNSPKNDVAACVEPATEQRLLL